MTELTTVIGAWAQVIAPPSMQNISTWADAYRRLPEASAARGGRWRTSTAAYLRGIMDAAVEPGVRTIAVRKAHQCGGSEALNNIIGYFVASDGCPILLVHPTAAAAEAFSKERLADMIRTTPALAAVVQDKRLPSAEGRPESTLSLKMFPGGFLALGGANTPNTFARWAVRIAIADDCDRFPPVVGDEGDPAELLVNRTTSFHDRLAIFVSTPTLKGGRIDTLYERSDRRRFHVACPACGREDFITWNEPTHLRVAFEDRDPATACLACPDEADGGCGTRLGEPVRGTMVAQGTWRPTAVAQEPGLVGFHVPAMLSPWVSLAELVAKFLGARARGRESFRVFVNTSLAEGWEDRGTRMEAHTLFARREDYGEGVEVPAAASAITAGVDVQGDRFEMLVLAWGPAGERWTVEWRTIPGDPHTAEAQAALLEALTRRYAHGSGLLLPIHATCIDSGFATESVYDFVLAHQVHRIFCTKGFAGRSGEPIVGKAAQKTYGRRPRPVLLYPVNVDDAKAEILASLALPVPGPGSMHFPIRVDPINDEFFAQLCAEHRETRYNKAGVATHYVWVQDRDRNDVLDAAVLALSACRLLNPNLRDMAERIAAAAAARCSAPAAPSQIESAGDPADPSPPLPAPSTPGRRTYRSSFMDRPRVPGRDWR
jgi:phage terminase large subunit GpA-like protein